MMVDNRKRTRDDYESCFYSVFERSDSNDSDPWCDTTHTSQESYSKDSFPNLMETNVLNDDYKAKREQRSRIHTEAHQKTVAMMMEAAKHLQFQQVESVSGETEDREVVSGYVQKPYW